MSAPAAPPRGVQFVFDAGPMARVHLLDVASRSVRAIFDMFAGSVHAPELIHAEVTAAWLQAVREGKINWDDYKTLLATLIDEIRTDQLILWRDGALLPGVLSVQERVTRLHLEQPNLVPVLHTHDAYYVALAETLQRELAQRVILVTNDARVWRCARALGMEVFHGNTCDLGRHLLNVGLPGQDFPEGANCSPCSYLTCPSQFVLDLTTVPPNLGSGTPRTRRERAAHSPAPPSTAT